MRLAINVIEDVTELKQVEQAQRFLAEASRVLAASLDYESTLAASPQLAVPASPTGAPSTSSATRRRARARRGRARRPGEGRRWPSELAERYPADPRADRGVHHVLRTGESQL